MKFLRCCCYLALTGAISFFVGRILPKSWFDPEHFPYRSFAFEKNGKFYETFKIRAWQNKVPDMSRILPGLMPAKRLGADYKERLPEMLQETCVAELIHSVLCITGFYCLKIWPSWQAIVLALIHALFLNLPFVMIQRYNRPRLLRLYRRACRQKETAEERSADVSCEY